MLQKIVDKLMGQADEGNRKMAYGTLAIVLIFVFLMWAPEIKPETRRSALNVFSGVVVVVITGNVMEHREKRKIAVSK